VKNRILISVAVVSYLLFYFFSPFFHFHDEWIQSFENIQFHSHLLVEETKKSDESHCHHKVDQHDEHNHPIVINEVVTKLSPRLVDTFNHVNSIQDIIEFEPNIESNETAFHKECLFDKLLKARCVHTSSNISQQASVTA